MRLLKLAAYAVLGYVIYEIYRGLTQGASQRPMGGGGGTRELKRALNEDAGRMMNMTGPGRGTHVDVDDSTGAHIGRVVGRGVV